MSTDPASLPRRRWFRLSLRAAMVLVLLVGGGAGWLAHTIRTQRAAVAVLKEAKQVFQYDWQMDQIGVVHNRPKYRTEPTAPRWLRSWLGDELFQSVRAVYLSGPVTPAVVGAVGQCDRIEDLYLTDLKPDANWFRVLHDLPRLHKLVVPAPVASNALLAEVARLPQLRDFDVLADRKTKATSPMTDEGLALLARLPELEDLSLHDCPKVTDAGTTRLVEGLPGLLRLHLMTGQTSVATTLPTLARRHPDLLQLGLDRSGVTDDDLSAVEGLLKLETLSMQVCQRVTDAGLAHLRPLLKLQILFANIKGITDAGLLHLSGLVKLQHLILSGSQVTDAGLIHLAPLTELKALHLNLTQVTDAGMPAVARLANLEDLWLSHLPGITDAGLVPLRSLTRLTRLEVARTQVTSQGIAALRQALPTLKRVNINRPAPPPKPTATAK